MLVLIHSMPIAEKNAVTADQREEFGKRGVLVLPRCVPPSDMDSLDAALVEELAIDSPRRVLEKDGKTVRSVYGSHLHHPVFARIARHPALLGAAQALLGHDVYVYQFKINIKAAFGGDVWEWHQDFVYWNREDGLPRPDIITLALCIDDVTEFNGPLFVVPGSQSLGLMESQQGPDVSKDRRQPYGGQPAWIANLVAALKYTIDQPTLHTLVDRFGLESMRGPRGSALVFHSNIVHSSPPNISPARRAIALISYSRTDNIPQLSADPRPDFLVARDYSALQLG
jgi:ectoine hydroxylase-related dioxygenase (phytanoyl-CoA dioxygenase family)